jgi:hypothetical protein
MHILSQIFDAFTLWAVPIHQLRSEIGLPALTGNPFIDDKYSPYLVLT